MSKLAAVVIFVVLTALVVLAVALVLPQGFDWVSFYDGLVSRMDSNRLLTTVLLVIYLFLSFWVLVAALRWIASLANTIASGRKEDAQQQTLDNTLIIDDPKLKRPTTKLAETLFSVAIWAFFIYLFSTILTTFMWLFGMERVYYFNFSQAAIEGTYETMLYTLYTAGFFIIVLVIWAQWNYWRFGRLNRRKPARLMETEEVAQFFSLPLATVQEIQSAKITVIVPRTDGFDYRELRLGEQQ